MVLFYGQYFLSWVMIWFSGQYDQLYTYLAIYIKNAA